MMDHGKSEMPGKTAIADNRSLKDCQPQPTALLNVTFCVAMFSDQHQSDGIIANR